MSADIGRIVRALMHAKMAKFEEKLKAIGKKKFVKIKFNGRRLSNGLHPTFLTTWEGKISIFQST